jgi:hypothetical protein
MCYEHRAMRAVWPKSIERVNLVEPSKEMQRAGQSLLDSKTIAVAYIAIHIRLCR